MMVWLLLKGLSNILMNHKCHTCFLHITINWLFYKKSNLFNVHVEAKKENDKMIFLYELKKGKTDKSYGIQVAALLIYQKN